MPTRSINEVDLEVAANMLERRMKKLHPHFAFPRSETERHAGGMVALCNYLSLGLTFASNPVFINVCGAVCYLFTGSKGSDLLVPKKRASADLFVLLSRDSRYRYKIIGFCTKADLEAFGIEEVYSTDTLGRIEAFRVPKPKLRRMPEFKEALKTESLLKI